MEPDVARLEMPLAEPLTATAKFDAAADVEERNSSYVSTTLFPSGVVAALKNSGDRTSTCFVATSSSGLFD